MVSEEKRFPHIGNKEILMYAHAWDVPIRYFFMIEEIYRFSVFCETISDITDKTLPGLW